MAQHKYLVAVYRPDAPLEIGGPPVPVCAYRVEFESAIDTHQAELNRQLAQLAAAEGFPADTKMVVYWLSNFIRPFVVEKKTVITVKQRSN